MVGVVRALDADIGENAEMDYRIIGSDGPGVFDIATNRSTQDGVIVLRKVGEGRSNGLTATASWNRPKLWPVSRSDANVEALGRHWRPWLGGGVFPMPHLCRR